MKKTRSTRSQKTQVFNLKTVAAIIVVVAVALGAVMVALAQVGQGPLAPTAGERARADFSTQTCSVPFTAQPGPTEPPCQLCEHQLDLFWGPTIRSFKDKKVTGSDGKQYSDPGTRYNMNVEPKFRRLLTFYNSKGSGVAGQPDVQSVLPDCSLTPMSVDPVPVTLPAPGTDTCDQILNKLKGSIEGIRYEPWDSPAGYKVLKRIGEPVLYNGYAKAIVENTSSDCTYDIGFASYKANWFETAVGNNPWGVENSAQELDTQNLFDQQHLTIAPGETKTLYVKVPSEMQSCHGTRPTQ